MSSTLHSTMTWSPESNSVSIPHSIQASAPSTIGSPVLGEWCQAMPAHLSQPERAKERLTGSWSALSTLTQHVVAVRTSGKVDDVFATENATSGGSIETLKND